MRIIITESQSKILWLRRRLNDPEMMNLLKDIVIEGFDYTDPCNYGTYDSFETNIVNESAITFINSYNELSGEDPLFSSDNALEHFVVSVIVSRYRPMIQREYRNRYCEEDDDIKSNYFLP